MGGLGTCVTGQISESFFYSFNTFIHSYSHLCASVTKQYKKLRYRGEHSASDVGTNRKLICDFLLVINTNSFPILHRFQVMAGQIFASDRVSLHFNALAGGDPLRIPG